MQSRKDSNLPLLSKQTEPQNSLQEHLKVAKEITIASIPNMFSSIGSQLKDVISLYFIGHLNNPLLFAAAGFGLTWVNAFGMALIFGFTTAFGTLASQAFGARNYEKLGVLYQKSCVVLSLVLLGLATFLWFTKDALMIFGFEDELAAKIGHFVRYLIIDLYCYMFFEVTRFYLTAQNLFEVPAGIIFFSTALHIFWCHLFVNILGLELIGMAIARTLTDGIAAGLVVLYVKWKNPCPESWFPWRSDCLEELPSHTIELASHGGAIYIEWMAFETMTMVIGALGDVNVLAAHSAALNYLFVNSTLSLGVALSMNVFVGNAAGEGKKEKAKMYAKVGLILDFIVVTTLAVLMFMFRRNIAAFYTSEPLVRGLTADILLIYSFGVHADLCCNTFANLLRTLGQDRYVIKSFVTSYYGVGFTCSLVFGLWLGYGYRAVWASAILGCFVMLALDLIRFFGLDWEYEVKKICNDMRRASTIEDSYEAIELKEV